jgi:hypothetical protein
MIACAMGVQGEDGGERLTQFEAALVRLQLAVEDSFLAVALAEQRDAVILHDRGVLDPHAYVRPEDWEAVLAHGGWSEGDLLKRYDLVLHLVTAADGAERFYTSSNNAARTETPAEARMLDARVMEVWRKHPRVAVFGNDTDFAGKLESVTQHVRDFIRGANWRA